MSENRAVLDDLDVWGILENLGFDVVDEKPQTGEGGGDKLVKTKAKDLRHGNFYVGWVKLLFSYFSIGADGISRCLMNRAKFLNLSGFQANIDRVYMFSFSDFSPLVFRDNPLLLGKKNSQ
jgi:hypothetical protein